MSINAIASNKVSKLLSPRVVGRQVKGGTKVLGKQGLSISAPLNATTYDLVNGLSKKGEFQLFAFKDESGNVVQHYTRYFKDNNGYTDVIIDTDRSTGIINRTKQTINGLLNGDSNVEKIEHSSLLPYVRQDNGKLFAFQKSYMTMTPSGDFGGQEICRQGKKAAGFKYKYNWDGTPTNIEYKNTLGQKLDITETEAQYLPFINRRFVVVEQDGVQTLATMDFTPDRVDEKIQLSQVIQERLHGIKENLLPRAKAVKQDDLVSIKVTGKTADQLALERDGMRLCGEALPDGQINIATDFPNGTDGVLILDRMAHEVQHEADIIAMYKGGDEAALEACSNLGEKIDDVASDLKDEKVFYNQDGFVQKCIKENGVFPKGTSEYDEAVKLYEMNINATKISDLEDLASHDAMAIERRAIEREQEQMSFYNQFVNKISAFISQFLA